MIENDCHK